MWAELTSWAANTNIWSTIFWHHQAFVALVQFRFFAVSDEGPSLVWKFAQYIWPVFILFQFRGGQFLNLVSQWTTKIFHVMAQYWCAHQLKLINSWKIFIFGYHWCPSGPLELGFRWPTQTFWVPGCLGTWVPGCLGVFCILILGTKVDLRRHFKRVKAWWFNVWTTSIQCRRHMAQSSVS
jgi:hypothetical protein